MSDNPTPTGSNELPEWARKELTEVRTEAATRRTQLRDVETKLTEIQGQVQTLSTQKTDAETRAAQAEASLLKVNVAIEAGIPGGEIAQFVKYLQGSTEAELKASAAELAPRFASAGSQPAYDPSQGRGGNPTNVPDTAEAQFLQWFANIQGTPLN